jgi:hypothetical protein
MPLISQFFGILISMYKEDGGRHNMPHFHAYYGDFEGVFDLQGDLIVGNLPTKQRKLVETWAIIHEEELNAEWKSIIELGQHFKIDGLR